MKEFEPVVLMASIPHMLAVANKVPVSNVKELIALAKAKPDTLTFGTTGPGTIQRIATEYLRRHRRHQAGARALQGRQRDHDRDPAPARST